MPGRQGLKRTPASVSEKEQDHGPNEISVRRRALHRVQRLRHRLQAGARHSLGSESTAGGYHQRRRAGRALHLGRVHALLGCAVHGGVPGRLLLQDRGRRRPARQGPVHRLRLLFLCLPVRRAAVPANGSIRRARQDGQVHVLRRRPRAGRLARGIRQIRAQPAKRRQAAGVRRNVLDQGAAGWRRRRAFRHLSHAGDDARGPVPNAAPPAPATTGGKS